MRAALALVEPTVIEGLAPAEHEAVAQVNALEMAAFRAEEEPSDLRWEQARWVAQALESGLSTRKLAALWRNPETGEPYGHVHVHYVKQTWDAYGSVHLGERPRFNTAYHSDAVRKKTSTSSTNPVVAPIGTFATIVADPPWRYDNKATRGAAEDHYPTMSIEELCDLPVVEWSAPESHLYLWTTNGFLREAFGVLESWGFDYKTTLVWVKPQIGMGNYFRSSAEYVLFGIRGGLRTRDCNQPNWFNAPRSQHSKKPGLFFDLVEKASYPPYLEMFARQRRLNPDWSYWGNEA